ncbi:hypothetical protein ACW95P_03315 [Candidatus Mycoplasma pogonae]
MTKNLNKIKPGNISKNQANKFVKNSENIHYNLVEVEVVNGKLNGLYYVKFEGYSEMEKDEKNTEIKELKELVLGLVGQINNFTTYVENRFALQDARDAERDRKDEEFRQYVITRLDAQDKKIDQIQATQIEHGKRLDRIESDITDIKERLTNLEGRVTVLESYHQQIKN